MTAPSTLATVLSRCAAEEGGIRPLARALGLSPQTVYVLLRDERLPGKHVARAVADYLSGRDYEGCALTPEQVCDWASSSD